MMKRRYFIWLSLLAGSVIAIPGIFNNRLTALKKQLITPDMLSRFCDEESIRKIGIEYLAKFPFEKDEKILKKLIVSGRKGISMANAEITVDEDQINKQIRNEFKSNDIIIIEGWVLTTTEARQCALLSLSERKS